MGFRLPSAFDLSGLPQSANGLTTASADQKVGEAVLRANSDFGQTDRFSSAVTSPLGTSVMANYGLSVNSSYGGPGFKQPTTSVISAGRINDTLNQNGPPPDDTSHMVSLTDQDGYTILFKVMPEIAENRSAEYEAVQPPQFPGAFMKYKGTSPTTWTLNVTLISRTTEEATENLRHINRIRSWTMPFFGENTAKDFPTRKGAPPMVLRLRGLRGLIGDVPVVLTSPSWNWPKDVDYLPAIPDYLTGNDPRLMNTWEWDWLVFRIDSRHPFPGIHQSRIITSQIIRNCRKIVDILRPVPRWTC